MISNKECDIIRNKGLLEGLESRLISLEKIDKDTIHDLSDEIERVKNEILIVKSKI